MAIPELAPSLPDEEFRRVDEPQVQEALADVVPIRPELRSFDPMVDHPYVEFTPRRAKILARIAEAQNPWVRATAIVDLNNDTASQRMRAGDLSDRS